VRRRGGAVGEAPRGGGRRGVQAHAEEERSARRRCGGGRCGIERHTKKEQSARCQRGGGQRGVDAHAEEER
jgi:hypothetical protein